MKTKCYKCGYKNELNTYCCEKCGEIFWQSKKKYNEYIKKQKKETEDAEKKRLEFREKNPDADKVQKYPISKRIVRLPIILIARDNTNISSEKETLIFFFRLFVSLCTFFLRKGIINIVTKYKRYTEPLVILLTIIGMIIFYFIGIVALAYIRMYIYN